VEAKRTVPKSKRITRTIPTAMWMAPIAMRIIPIALRMVPIAKRIIRIPLRTVPIPLRIIRFPMGTVRNTVSILRALGYVPPRTTLLRALKMLVQEGAIAAVGISSGGVKTRYRKLASSD
jgi:hypothetical protein